MVRREARISFDSSAGVSVASALGERDHAADLVGQLPEVAGPVVEQQVLEGLVAQGRVALALLVGEPADVVLDQRRDLLAPLPQRRDVEPERVEPVEQVLAEAAVGDQPPRGWRWWRR